MSVEALPCIICGTPLKNVYEDAENQPNDGVACTTAGNYGSTVYDSIMTAEFLEFNICDPCLIKAGEQDRVYVGRNKQPVYIYDVGLVGWVPVLYKPVYWKNRMPGYDDQIYVDSLAEARELHPDVRLDPSITDEGIAALRKEQE